jgi:hypothetical protein
MKSMIESMVFGGVLVVALSLGSHALSSGDGFLVKSFHTLMEPAPREYRTRQHPRTANSYGLGIVITELPPPLSTTQ